MADVITTPISLDLFVVASQPNITINVAVLLPSQTISVEMVQPFLDVDCSFLANVAELVIDVQAPIIKLGVSVSPNFTTIGVEPHNPAKVGGVYGETIIPPTLLLRLTPNYIKSKINIGILVSDVPEIQIQNNIQPVTVAINPKPVQLNIQQHSISVNVLGDCNTPRRVIAIDNIELPTALHWSDVYNKFTSTTEVTEDGDTIHFVMPLKKFTQRQQLDTSTQNSMRFTLARKILALVDDEVHRLYFDDASFEDFKFDKLQNPLIAEPIYEGSDGVYVTIKVLI